MHGFRRPPILGAAALLVAAGLAGCASVVDGTGAPGPSGGTASTASSSAPTGPSSTAPASSGSATTTSASSTSTTSKPTDPVTDLRDLLAPGPPDSHPWGTAWSNNGTPTVGQFVAHVYPASAAAGAKASLRSQGIRDIAHRTWVGKANQADDVLLRFEAPEGARARYESVAAAQAGAPGEHKFAIPGPRRAVGFFDPKLDDLGNVRTIIYGQVGTVVMELFFYSPGKLDKDAAVTSATEQLGRLPG
jgi:hypothetical protein